jgi:periplasmic protein TonB
MRPDDSEANSLQNPRKSDPITLPQGFLADCMVDADPNTATRAGRARGRAFGISALAQASLLILFLIVPLFAVSKLTPANNVIPIAPYGAPPRRGKDTKPQENPRPPEHGRRIIPQGPVFPTRTTTRRNEATDDHDNIEPSGPLVPGVSWGSDRSDSDSIGLLPIPGFHDGPRPPQAETDKNPVSKPIEVSQGAELGKLIYRVEPVYPIFAIHNSVEGTVELRAIIGRDGTVREVQVLSGNAFLILAAKQAVLQWRFRPTLLNGKPVEVDTFFTVNFRINQ